jgi:tetratricopeptide (TPR) repeat protein
LLDGRSGAQKWSDSYDRDVRDVLKVQEDIATGLARALQITVDAELDVKHSVKSPEAHDFYLRGLTALDKGTHPAVDEAVTDFEQAFSLDPDYAAAALGLAWAYIFAGSEAWILPGEAYPKARQWAELALRLDPKLGEAHADLAWIHVAYDWDWAAAQRELALAQKLGGMVDSIDTAVALAMNAGHCDQAAQLLKPTLVTDPLNSGGYSQLAHLVYLRCGRYADAEVAERRGLEISPGASSNQYFLSVALMLQGKFDEALAAATAQSAESGQCEGEALVYFAMGRKAESDAMLKKCTARAGGYWASEIARIHAFRGEPDQAMEWLERAYSQHDEDLFFIKGDPLLKNLEKDPRYKAFLKKMNLPE